MYDPFNVYRDRYKEFIENIMKERPINEHFDYSSYHHVIPECCGGKDNEDENIRVYLTHKEHFIAHKILSEDNPSIRGLQYAFWRMCNGRVTQATPEEYEEARIRVSKNMREDNPASRDGVRFKIAESHKKENISEAYRRNMSVAAQNRPPISEETRKRQSAVRRGHTVSEETRRKSSESNRGQKRSNETRKNISVSLTGKFSDAQREAMKHRVYQHICERCGEEFTNKSSKGKYCPHCRGDQ